MLQIDCRLGEQSVDPSSFELSIVCLCVCVGFKLLRIELKAPNCYNEKVIGAFFFFFCSLGAPLPFSFAQFLPQKASGDFLFLFAPFIVTQKWPFAKIAFGVICCCWWW